MEKRENARGGGQRRMSKTTLIGFPDTELVRGWGEKQRGMGVFYSSHALPKENRKADDFFRC